MEAPNFAYDIFLSHNRQQKAWVRRLCGVLRDCGLRVFFDEDTIQPGEDVIRAIERAVESSKHVLLVISPGSISSRWVALETAIAVYEDPDASARTLIPIMLEKVDATALSPSVRRLNRIDLSVHEDRNDRLKYLLRSIGVFASESVYLSLWDPENVVPTMGSKPELNIADQSDVISWGWTGEKLLEELIRLDYETIEGLTADHEGHVAQWAPVFMDHPDTWRLIVKRPGEVVGYWHFVPLFEKEMRLARQGKLLDSDITTEKVRFFELQGHYDIYFVSLCMKAQFRRSFAVAPLLRSLLDVTRDLAREGIFFREICSNAYTQSGAAICKSFDLKHITDHNSHGKIFARRAYPFPPLRMMSGYPELLNLYGSEFWASKRSNMA